MIRTFKFRVKDSSSRELCRLAGKVNFVWNYCNEASHRSITYNRKFLTHFDLGYLMKGCSKELGVPDRTMNLTAKQYTISRNTRKKARLKWRSKKSLGWIPFDKYVFKLTGTGEAVYHKTKFRFWQSTSIHEIKSGSFNQDARGRWYLNLACECPDEQSVKTGQSIGIDLGLKTTATYSDGTSFVGVKATAKYADKLAMAQRANKKKLVRTIHAKIENSRRDSLHKETTRIAKANDLIVVGGVSSNTLKKTKMAKSVSDASWGAYKSMLEYKTIRFGRELKVVNESWTSRTCHVCDNLADFGGLSGLSVREWCCSSCGTVHDRDVNAAKNILRLGHQPQINGALC